MRRKTNKDSIQCPYCGLEARNSEEYHKAATYHCGYCDRTCTLRIKYKPIYSTYRDCDAEGKIHKWTIKCEWNKRVGEYLNTGKKEYIYCICTECETTRYILKSELRGLAQEEK